MAWCRGRVKVAMKEIRVKTYRLKLMGSCWHSGIKRYSKLMRATFSARQWVRITTKWGVRLTWSPISSRKRKNHRSHTKRQVDGSPIKSSASMRTTRQEGACMQNSVLTQSSVKSHKLLSSRISHRLLKHEHLLIKQLQSRATPQLSSTESQRSHPKTSQVLANKPTHRATLQRNSSRIAIKNKLMMTKVAQSITRQACQNHQPVWVSSTLPTNHWARTSWPR